MSNAQWEIQWVANAHVSRLSKLRFDEGVQLWDIEGSKDRSLDQDKYIDV